MQVSEPSAKYMAKAAEYKQTDIGLIPQDWEVKPLGQLINSVEYGSSSKSSPQGAIPVLRMGNLQDGRIDWGNLVYTSNEFEISKYRLNSGDVLFNRTNTPELVGKTAIYAGEQPAIFAGYLIRIKTKATLDPVFLNYILNTEFSRKYSTQVLSIAVGQANINGKKLKTYPIPTPPTVQEQQAIATALSDTDTLIDALEQLLAKKRQVKQGAMRELLTGERRLEGFHQDWQSKRLDELGQWSGGMTPSMQNLDYWHPGTIPWITSGDIKFMRLFTTNLRISKKALQAGATNSIPEKSLVVVMRSGILRNYLPVTMNMVPMTINQDVKALIPKKFVYPDFLLQSLTFHGEQILARCLKSGTTVESIEYNWLKSFTIQLPPLPEQIAIAAILSDMDTDITELETRLGKVRQVKQGMMRELLTGRTRLV